MNVGNEEKILDQEERSIVSVYYEINLIHLFYWGKTLDRHWTVQQTRKENEPR